MQWNEQGKSRPPAVAKPGAFLIGSAPIPLEPLQHSLNDTPAPSHCNAARTSPGADGRLSLIMDTDPDAGLAPRFAPFIGMVRYQLELGVES
jgi:hypothetical protein